MKNSIFITLMLVSLFSKAQIRLEGKGEKLDSLNTSNGQNYLVIHPNDKIIAFTEERGSVSNTTDLYSEQLRLVENENWKTLVFPDWLGEKGLVSPIGFAENGLFYSQVIFDKGMYYGKVRFNSGGNDREVSIPFFKNKSPIQSGCLSKDGQYMILSLESNNTRGVEDLYVVKRGANGSWEKAKNLGFQLNTEFQEVTPFLAEDNRTLFFATNGRGGQGSFDIFYAVRQDDSWRNWSEPVNLGPSVNTSGAETSFTFKDGGEWAYYVSSQDSDGYGDIFRVKFSEDLEEDTSRVEEPLITNEDQPKGLESIILKIVDAKTKEAIAGEMIVGEEKQIGPNGLFEIDTLNGREIELKSLGYLPKVVVLDDQIKSGENIIELASVAKGSVITLDHVLFHRGTANMIEGSEKELDLVVEVLNDNPSIKILLKGHTDNTGDPVKNVQLSEARVKSVKAYILSQGINAFRVSGKGFGGNQPIASNATEETRKLNRRVEFEVVAD